MGDGCSLSCASLLRHPVSILARVWVIGDGCSLSCVSLLCHPFPGRSNCPPRGCERLSGSPFASLKRYCLSQLLYLTGNTLDSFRGSTSPCLAVFWGWREDDCWVVTYSQYSHMPLLRDHHRLHQLCWEKASG